MTDHLPDEQCKGLLANATVRWADDMPLDLTPWRNPLTTQSVPAHGANIGAPVPARVENASGSVGLPWFCFYTEPREEKQAFDGIVALGFAARFFRFLSFRRHYGRMEPMVKALFPRYVLASFDPDADAWGPILQVRGVRCVLAAPSGRPVQLRPGEVERLQALGRAADGVICEGLPGMVPVQPAPAAVRSIRQSAKSDLPSAKTLSARTTWSARSTRICLVRNNASSACFTCTLLSA